MAQAKRQVKTGAELLTEPDREEDHCLLDVWFGSSKFSPPRPVLCTFLFPARLLPVYVQHSGPYSTCHGPSPPQHCVIWDWITHYAAMSVGEWSVMQTVAESAPSQDIYCFNWLHSTLPVITQTQQREVNGRVLPWMCYFICVDTNTADN